ncbi:MAG: SAM-dependent methyltransferase, partial [Eubacteriales bacterium]|nr:SAM-dependent methyltransferase [Eubacteriales bacterium]
MIDTVPEEDWRDAVQIIGWLYQYYNSEKKDEVFAALKKNVKITKDNIPAATQLFTPDWIVRYMVENSLGRTYIRYKVSVDSGQWAVGSEEERQAKEKEIAESLGWKYYIPEAKQTEEVRKQLNTLNPDTFDPKNLRLLDPCAGSGHILAYMFDVLVTIYQDYGYTTREAAASIVSQNLYGLDIDTRAAQLAYFTVMMKARQYDRRFFSRGIQPHVHAITESNHVGEFARNHFALDNPSVKEAFDTTLEELRDAKEYGSILTVTPQNWEALESNLEELEHSTVHSDGKRIRNLLQTAETLSQKYDVVVTNPPYMGGSGMSPKLSAFVKKHYPNSKSDLST